jgi:hypothetical protein
MSPEEIVGAAFHARRERLIGQALSDWRANVQRLILALRSLTKEHGQRIAQDVWRDFNPEKDDYLLAQLGASDPNALATIQEDLVERTVFNLSHLHLRANDDIAETLIEIASVRQSKKAGTCCCCASHGLATSVSYASSRCGVRIRQHGRANSIFPLATNHWMLAWY